MRRRNFLLHGLRIFTAALLEALGIEPARAGAWRAEDFRSTDFASAFAALFGGQAITESDGLQISLPEIAENGAVVPLTIDSTLSGIDKLYVWVENNPTPLAAQFDLSPNLLPFVTARVKMAESGYLRVIARQGENWLQTRKWVTVVQGGCGTG